MVKLLIIFAIFMTILSKSLTEAYHSEISIELSNVSAQPLVELGGKNYYFETSISSNWFEAKTFCRNVGLFLVSIETIEEYELIRSYIKTLGTRHYWTSGNDLGNWGNYIWDSTGKPISFFDWGPNEPGDNGGSEGIIVLAFYNNENTYHWIDVEANKYPRFAICEQL